MQDVPQHSTSQVSWETRMDDMRAKLVAKRDDPVFEKLCPAALKGQAAKAKAKAKTKAMKAKAKAKAKATKAEKSKSKNAASCSWGFNMFDGW